MRVVCNIVVFLLQVVFQCWQANRKVQWRGVCHPYIQDILAQRARVILVDRIEGKTLKSGAILISPCEMPFSSQLWMKTTGRHHGKALESLRHMEAHSFGVGVVLNRRWLSHKKTSQAWGRMEVIGAHHPQVEHPVHQTSS